LLFADFKKVSTYIQNLVLSFSGILLVFLISGNFSILNLIYFSGLSFLGTLMSLAILSALGSFYLISGRIEKALKGDSISSVQEFTMYVIAKASESYDNANEVRLSYSGYKYLNITSFFYSPRTQKEIFEPIIADWQEEYFEALSKKETWKSRWINVRYTYAFLGAMWQKSPLGNLIEFISKLAK
jgi:hypothetical protein